MRFEKVAVVGGGAERYSMDHSAGMFLLAPGGQFLARFPYGMPSVDVAERLRNEIQRRVLAAGEAAAPAK